MNQSDTKLQAIRQMLEKGVAPPTETPRSILLWFGAYKRGWRVCSEIRSSLRKYNLQTLPDFEYAYIDGALRFTDAPKTEAEPAASSEVDPTYRIERLAAANRKPVSIKPDDQITKAVTIMLAQDFSQLPVMTNEREVKGIISWKGIGSKLSINGDCTHVREAMEPAHEISVDESLFSAISTIAQFDYVLVRNRDRVISGIITASDFNVQFQQLAEPFLLIGEIENGVRQILHGKFSKAELESAKLSSDSGRIIEGVTDLTFGEYIKLIETEAKWKKLGLAIDRPEFVKSLHQIREIRNDVMHFDPDGLDDADYKTLREFAAFLRRLREIRK
jgi:Predicted transcriptional regulator with C-terminal CBS domains